MEISLKNKVAVVTGASSGIGLAITRAYLDCGAKVVAVFRRNEIPAELQECIDLYPDTLVIVRGDVAAEQTAIDFTKAALEKFGSLDVFLSNAAISVVKPIHLHTEEDWDTVMNANVKSLYWASKHVIPVMMEQKKGLILISGSISGEAGIPTQGAYAPSKAALHQMTRQMAIEYAKYGIRVNTVACGTVDTPIVHNSANASGDPEGYWKMLRERPPHRPHRQRRGSCRLLRLHGDRSRSFFTGSIIMLDGGYTAQ